MTKALEQALREAAKLPDEDQDALAEAILAEIRSDEAWQEAFASSQDVLRRLAEEAIEEHRSGRTKPLDPETM